MLLVRFLIGGAVVSLVPIVARQFGPAVAALLVLIPAITLVSYAFIGHSQGEEGLLKVVPLGFPGLLAVAAFIAGTWGALLLGASWPLALLAASLSWTLAAAVIVFGPQALLAPAAATVAAAVMRPSAVRLSARKLHGFWRAYTEVPWAFRFASVVGLTVLLMLLSAVAPTAAVALLILGLPFITQTLWTVLDPQPVSP